jgi:Phospholipid methyltransferase
MSGSLGGRARSGRGPRGRVSRGSASPWPWCRSSSTRSKPYSSSSSSGGVYLHDPSLTPSAPPTVIAIAVVLFLAGQSLVVTGFYRLGRVAVFFGDRLGYDAPWCSAFPFSVLPHPQYFGAVLSIWAFFAVMRWPHADWCVIPLIETILYVAGATLEERSVAAQGASGRAPSNPTLSKD